MLSSSSLNTPLINKKVPDESITLASKTTLNNIPSDILIFLFLYLDPSEWLSFSCTAKYIAQEYENFFAIARPILLAPLVTMQHTQQIQMQNEAPILLAFPRKPQSMLSLLIHATWASTLQTEIEKNVSSFRVTDKCCAVTYGVSELALMGLATAGGYGAYAMVGILGAATTFWGCIGACIGVAFSSVVSITSCAASVQLYRCCTSTKGCICLCCNGSEDDFSPGVCCDYFATETDGPTGVCLTGVGSGKGRISDLVSQSIEKKLFSERTCAAFTFFGVCPPGRPSLVNRRHVDYDPTYREYMAALLQVCLNAKTNMDGNIYNVYTILSENLSECLQNKGKNCEKEAKEETVRLTIS